MSSRARTIAGWALALGAILSAWSGGTAIWNRAGTPRPVPGPGLIAGPGGPLLFVHDPRRPFGAYLSEILRAEGLNAFSTTTVDSFGPASLRNRSVVLLAQLELDSSQVGLLENWVAGGGGLVAIRPQNALLGLFGLAPAADPVDAADVRVEDGRAGSFTRVPLRVHGEVDLWRLDGAELVARVLHDTVSTPWPAVSARRGGMGAGRTVAFAWDLPRSVVLTRQGNPAWAGQERDGIAPRRSNDLFFGASAEDPRPDWVDLGRIGIPHADEQQRLLANLILEVSGDRMPLPRFWYFPDRHRAVVLMTGDHHGCCENTAERFARYVEQSPEGCVVEDWECVRASAYVFPDENLEDFDAARWHALGFEIGVHVDTGCRDFDPATLDRRFVAPQLSLFSLRAPQVPRQVSERTHCVVWSDWATRARVNAAHGIRLDTNYYFWPPDWVGDRPGLFSGSAMPMRFADRDGTLLDVYQVATQMTDESGQTYPRTAEVLLDRALGAEGFFGVFAANMHMDQSPHPESDAIVEAALARGVPVVSGRQLLTWVDGRNASRFEDLRFADGELSFTVVQAEGARNLQAMLPLRAGSETLEVLRRGGEVVDLVIEEVRGIEYALFAADSGTYSARYGVD